MRRSDEDHQSTEEYSADEGDGVRTSIDSQAAPLDPVFEEEEETTAGAAIETPTVPTRNPARSNSPQKRAGSVQPGAEEQMIVRAAHAAQEHPSRNGGIRNESPPPNNWTVTTSTETVTIIPGTDDVPGLPRGANGSFESLDMFGDAVREVEVLRAGGSELRGEFEWPDDVF